MEPKILCRYFQSVISDNEISSYDITLSYTIKYNGQTIEKKYVGIFITIFELPIDCITEIFEYLTIKDIISMYSIRKTFNNKYDNYCKYKFDSLFSPNIYDDSHRVHLVRWLNAAHVMDDIIMCNIVIYNFKMMLGYSNRFLNINYDYYDIYMCVYGVTNALFIKILTCEDIYNVRLDFNCLFCLLRENLRYLFRKEYLKNSEYIVRSLSTENQVNLYLHACRKYRGKSREKRVSMYDAILEEKGLYSVLETGVSYFINELAFIINSFIKYVKNDYIFILNSLT